jgi:hypothetical protein
MPNSNKVTAILENLFEGMVVKPGRIFDLVEQKATIGVYVNDGGHPVAACAMDLPLAAALGSALSMMPPSVCKEAVTNGALSENMKENLKEIMNINSRLLMDDFSAHLKLGSVHPARGLPRNSAVMLTEVHHRAHFHITLPRYGGGYMSVMSV